MVLYFLYIVVEICNRSHFYYRCRGYDVRTTTCWQWDSQRIPGTNATRPSMPSTQR